MHSPQFRAATFDDLEIVFSFIFELERIDFNKSTFAENFEQAAKDPNAILLVAEVDKQIIGFTSCFSQVLLHHNGRIGEIQEMFVVKDFRGKGVGGLLVKAIEEIAKERQWLGIEVCANIKRLEAHNFYQHLGFSQTHYKFTKEF
jgi:PhnO protein